jgi:uncharacterized membrane protein YccC
MNDSNATTRKPLPKDAAIAAGLWLLFTGLLLIPAFIIQTREPFAAALLFILAVVFSWIMGVYLGIASEARNKP